MKNMCLVAFLFFEYLKSYRLLVKIEVKLGKISYLFQRIQFLTSRYPSGQLLESVSDVEYGICRCHLVL